MLPQMMRTEIASISTRTEPLPPAAPGEAQSAATSINGPVRARRLRAVHITAVSACAALSAHVVLVTGFEVRGGHPRSRRRDKLREWTDGARAAALDPARRARAPPPVKAPTSSRRRRGHCRPPGPAPRAAEAAQTSPARERSHSWPCGPPWPFGHGFLSDQVDRLPAGWASRKAFSAAVLSPPSSWVHAALSWLVGGARESRGYLHLLTAEFTIAWNGLRRVRGPPPLPGTVLTQGAIGRSPSPTRAAARPALAVWPPRASGYGWSWTRTTWIRLDKACRAPQISGEVFAFHAGCCRSGALSGALLLAARGRDPCKERRRETARRRPPARRAHRGPAPGRWPRQPRRWPPRNHGREKR